MEQVWVNEQKALKEQLVETSDYTNPIKYIGGVDISFVKNDAINACAALVVLNYDTLDVVYQQYKMVNLTKPYIPGFLAFREVDHLLDLISDLRRDEPRFVPDVIMVDGNGVLHPRGFGLACHLGVLAGIPTIGIGKTLMTCDGIMNEKELRAVCADKLLTRGDSIDIHGNSRSWGKALRPTDKGGRAIYVSVGHRVSIDDAVAITLHCCKHKIPEPVRQADLGSREFIRLSS